MNREYKRTLARLNVEQKRAVRTIDGPVLVVAGPGTGKTELLSSRVAYILDTTDTDPQNILCLTFTNKAAVNMKQRIIQQTGSAGGRVVASTFHSFAGEIMNLHPDYFWNAARLTIAPDTLQIGIIESIVEKLPLDNPLSLKFAGQYTLLSSIAQGIKLAKEAGLTPAKLRALIEANLAYVDAIEKPLSTILETRLSPKMLTSFARKIQALPAQDIDDTVYPLTSLTTVIRDSLAEAIEKDEGTGKCSHTSKWKARWVQSIGGRRAMYKERDRNNWWLELASVYDLYREELHRRSYYDYDDMLVEVISQLEQNAEMLADIQERYAYVLIDEFQDTTPAQLRLAHLVADHYTAEGRPNLMAVGDDDQTIYKFNGAELGNMLGFKRRYKDAKVIVLTESYRSTQGILDVAQAIIEQAHTRLVDSDPSLNKKLVAKSPVAKGTIRAVAYASQELQLSTIARDIQKKYRPGKEIAVLARGHNSLVKMASILNQLKVPVRYEQATNILEHELIAQTYLVCQLLLAIRDGNLEASNALIHQIIRWPAWGLAPEQLWRLALKTKNNWLEDMLSSPDKQLRALAKWLLELSAAADNQPLAVTFEEILGLRSGRSYSSPVKTYLTHRAGSDTNGYFHALSAIQLLRALVHEFAAGQDPTIADFVRFIQINKDNNIVVSDESPFITGQHAVQLLTVHKAKGLEFDSVYIIDAIEDNWRPKVGGRKPPSNLPLQPPLDDFDDYVRLLYVAATRTKSDLTVGAYYLDHNGKDVGVSSIVQGAFNVEKVEEGDRHKLVEVLEQNLLWPDLAGGLEREMLKARLDSYSLYATHLLNFLDVTRGGPAYFKETNLLYLPSLKTASMAYGTAMHKALETAQKLTNLGKFRLSTVKREFEVALAHEQLPPDESSRRRIQGLATLERLFNDFGYKLLKGSLSEQTHKAVQLGSARIGGTLDRTDHHEDEVTIVDYKTGAPLGSFETKDKTKAIRAYKHRLQLIFYALIINTELGIPIDKITGQMVYPEVDSPKALERSYSPSREDIDRLRQLVAAVWQKIQNLDFPDIGNYSDDITGIKAFEQDLIDGK